MDPKPDDFIEKLAKTLDEDWDPDAEGEDREETARSQAEFEYRVKNHIDDAEFEEKLATMHPEEAQGWVRKFPEHGKIEAPNKVLNIISYGPEYHNSLIGLIALAKYWSLNADEVRKECDFAADSELGIKVDEFFQKYAHIFKS